MRNSQAIDFNGEVYVTVDGELRIIQLDGGLSELYHVTQSPNRLLEIAGELWKPDQLTEPSQHRLVD
mgnify:CR=1 FL=1